MSLFNDQCAMYMYSLPLLNALPILCVKCLFDSRYEFLICVTESEIGADKSFSLLAHVPHTHLMSHPWQWHSAGIQIWSIIIVIGTDSAHSSDQSSLSLAQTRHTHLINHHCHWQSLGPLLWSIFRMTSSDSAHSSQQLRVPLHLCTPATLPKTVLHSLRYIS